MTSRPSKPATRRLSFSSITQHGPKIPVEDVAVVIVQDLHDFVVGREERAEPFGSDFQADRASGHLHGNCTQKIAFADVHAAMAQDRVGGCEMEIEVWQHEMV
jgi:hypothetical protein